MKKGTNGPSSAFTDKYSRHLAAGLVAVVILFSAAVRLRLLSIPLERDEGEYAYAGQLLLKGLPANESWLKRPGSEGLIFGWMAKYIKNEFDLVGVAEIVSLDTTRYYWDDEPRKYSSHASPSLLVYKRRDAPGH